MAVGENAAAEHTLRVRACGKLSTFPQPTGGAVRAWALVVGACGNVGNFPPQKGEDMVSSMGFVTAQNIEEVHHVFETILHHDTL